MAGEPDYNAIRQEVRAKWSDCDRNLTTIGKTAVVKDQLEKLIAYIKQQMQNASTTTPEGQKFIDDMIKIERSATNLLEKTQWRPSLISQVGGAAAGGLGAAASYMINQQREANAQRAQIRAAREAAPPSFFSSPEPQAIPAEKHVGGLAGFLFFWLIYAISLNASLGGAMYALYLSVILLVWLLLSKEMKKEFVSFYGLFFVIAWAVHLYFFLQGFAFSTMNIFLVLAVYIAFAVCVWLFAPDKAETLRTSILITTLTLALYALPVFLSPRLPAFGQQVLLYGVAAAPIGVLYMLHKISMQNEGGYADKLWFWYKLFGIAIPLIILLVYANFKVQSALPDVKTPGVDVKSGISGFYHTLWDSTKKVFGKYAEPIKVIKDPGAYYTGEVEQNKKAPLGVKLTNVRPADRTVNNESPVLVYGNVEATSFIGTSVTVEPGCVIDRPGAPAAIVDPPGIEVLYGTGQSFQCSFPPLKSGTYTVQASASFPFETWAYIPYTFVDEERARNIAKQGQDINTVLDIPQQPKATYTSGPVTIGMGGSEQPILVRPGNDQILSPGTRIGVTIDSGWDKGTLQYVDKVELKVPRPFILTDCDRKELQGPQKDDKEPEEYTNYVFQNPTFDAASSYSSVTCKLAIPKDSDVEALVATDKTVRSFIAVVHYRYAVHEQTTVTVR